MVDNNTLTSANDMGEIEIGWDPDGSQITAEVSVLPMIDVIWSKNIKDMGTLWTWENEVISTPTSIVTTG
ncbi:hypothetical protein EMCG_02844 [[Emmonsia] crescens]|uniref:Uncharacterized protein n=1 Tax=[Emmonsia] crescens TaxID=73230 RepID=A0A0G2J8T7_9EURO|nr:hypothetical protein EMCG_02844 [Emmonsia crescens UAMH 3008]